MTDQFCRVVALAKRYIGLGTLQGDGIIYNSSVISQIFYTKDFAKAEECLCAMSTQDDSAFQNKMASDIAISDLAKEMTRLGFFSRTDPIAPMSVVWTVDDSVGHTSTQFEVHALSWSRLGLRSPLINARINLASNIPETWRRLKQTADETLRSLHKSVDATELKPAVNLISRLCGDKSAIHSLVQFLEQTGARFMFETDLQNDAPKNTVLTCLEEEGFLPTYRATISEQQLCDPLHRQAASRIIEQWLCEQPNREVEIRFRRPDVFGSSDHINKYYDGLQSLMETILNIDADLSRLSVVQRALRCLFQSPSSPWF